MGSGLHVEDPDRHADQLMCAEPQRRDLAERDRDGLARHPPPGERRPSGVQPALAASDSEIKVSPMRVSKTNLVSHMSPPRGLVEDEPSDFRLSRGSLVEVDSERSRGSGHHCDTADIDACDVALDGREHQARRGQVDPAPSR